MQLEQSDHLFINVKQVGLDKSSIVLSEKQVKSMLKFEKIKQVIDRSYSQKIRSLEQKFNPRVVNDRVKSRVEEEIKTSAGKMSLACTVRSEKSGLRN